jgi:hypothetical protein
MKTNLGFTTEVKIEVIKKGTPEWYKIKEEEERALEEAKSSDSESLDKE